MIRYLIATDSFMNNHHSPRSDPGLHSPRRQTQHGSHRSRKNPRRSSRASSSRHSSRHKPKQKHYNDKLPLQSHSHSATPSGKQRPNSMQINYSSNHLQSPGNQWINVPSPQQHANPFSFSPNQLQFNGMWHNQNFHAKSTSRCKLCDIFPHQPTYATRICVDEN